MIVDPDYLDHWKTKMLVGLLKDPAAPLYVLRLWAHCQNRKQDTFENLPTSALQALCHFPGNPSKLETSLADSGFVRRDDSGNLIVVGWADHNASLVAAWRNGKLGGRPASETQGIPTGNPPDTHGVTDREEKSREDRKRARFVAPTVEQVAAYCSERKSDVDARAFVDHYTSNGWRVGRNPMKDWKAAVRYWERNGLQSKPTQGLAPVSELQTKWRP